MNEKAVLIQEVLLSWRGCFCIAAMAVDDEEKNKHESGDMASYLSLNPASHEAFHGRCKTISTFLFWKLDRKPSQHQVIRTADEASVKGQESDQEANVTLMVLQLLHQD